MLESPTVHGWSGRLGELIERLLDGYRDRVDAYPGAFPKSKWLKLSCGAGTKGEKLYEWAHRPFGVLTGNGFQEGLLVRRSLSDPSDRAY